MWLVSRAVNCGHRPSHLGKSAFWSFVNCSPLRHLLMVEGLISYAEIWRRNKEVGKEGSTQELARADARLTPKLTQYSEVTGFISCRRAKPGENLAERKVSWQS